MTKDKDEAKKAYNKELRKKGKEELEKILSSLVQMFELFEKEKHKIEEENDFIIKFRTTPEKIRVLLFSLENGEDPLDIFVFNKRE